METYESFDWFREDIKTMNGQRRGKWVTTKGVALFPTVSRNQREYIEKECMLSARTLAGVPIDVNHQVDKWLEEQAVWEADNPGLSYESIKKEPPTWGNVIDAEWEDKTIEYVAQLLGEYGEKMIDRENLTEEEYVAKWNKTPIRGVSISASYRYAADDEDMLTPLGIKFNRLSLVEDPEQAGVQGTSIELMESYNRQSLKEIEVVGTLLKSVSPSLFESYRDEVIEPYKEGKPLENKEYLEFPVELNYGELHETKKPDEEETEEEESVDESETVEEESVVDESTVDEAEEPEEKDEEESDDEKKKKEDDDEEEDMTEADSIVPIPVKVEPITLEVLDFSKFDAEPELASETGDVEVDEKITEVNTKRRTDYEASRDKNVVESLKNLDEKLGKLVAHQNEVADASSVADNAIGVKVSESLKGLKEIQERLEDKAGVDKVEKLKTTIETLETKIEGQADKFKESDSELRQVIETVTSAVSTIKEFVDVTDVIKASVEDKEEKILQLKTALETSNENNGKLATKLADVETQADSKINELKTTLETANLSIVKLEQTLEDYDELKTQTASLTEKLATANETIIKIDVTEKFDAGMIKLNALVDKLEAVEKSIEDAKTEETSELEKALETVKERLENIEETAPGVFKSQEEVEHKEPKSIDKANVFKDIS